jgi:hypothetical protein
MTRKEMDMIIREYASAAEHYGYWKALASSKDEDWELYRDEADRYWKETKKARLKVVKMMKEVAED